MSTNTVRVRTPLPQVRLPALLAVIREWGLRARSRRELQALDERLLHDIGLTPAKADAEARKPFWQA